MILFPDLPPAARLRKSAMTINNTKVILPAVMGLIT